MFNIALYQPEIPPNTGNIIRLCANLGATLHLIHPLGFELSEKSVRRAGLDYHDLAGVQEHEDFAAFLAHEQVNRIFACSTKGSKLHTQANYQAGDCLLFGPETRGLPADILEATYITDLVRIPMCANNRSLNLANSVSIIAFEAWRQHDFAGGA